MTSSDDQRDEPSGDGPVEPRPSTDPPFDLDAAWRLIVDNYGERAQLGGSSTDPAPRPDPRPDLTHPQDPLLRAGPEWTSRGEEGRDDPNDDPDDDPDDDEDHARDRAGDRTERSPGRRDDRWDDTEHFVPPEPPPLPRATPARRLAWIGLLAPPVLMLVAVVLGWAFPTWLAFLLVASFVGGFVFLVATMPRDGGDGWGDGAVV